MKGQIVIRQTVFLLILACVLAAGSAWGETFYIQRNKVDVKKGRGAFFPTVYTAKMGEAFEVLTQKDGWYQVRTPKGNGWVFDQALAAKKPSKSMASFLGTTDSSELDKTAGFKGFDAPTEKEYIKNNNLKAQMLQVDRMQQRAFSLNELQYFQRKGHVGPMGGVK